MTQRNDHQLLCCSPKTEIEERALLEPSRAAGLELIFKVLANQTRLRILHALIRDEECCVGYLADALQMKISAVSNQLQLLSLRGIVSCRRNGNNILYRIVDPCTKGLLDYGLCLMEDLTSQRNPFEKGTAESMDVEGKGR